MRPRMKHLDLFRHVYREGNKEADALATQGVMGNHAEVTYNVCNLKPKYIRGAFDGGSRGDRTGYGWFIDVADQQDSSGRPRWQRYISVSVPLRGATVMCAELVAGSQLATAISQLIQGNLSINDYSRVTVNHTEIPVPATSVISRPCVE